MKRIQRTEKLLLHETIELLDRDQLHEHHPLGCTADRISEQLRIDRSNASRDLNALVNQKLAVKIGGKPVLFLSVEGLQHKFGPEATQLAAQYGSWSNFLKSLQQTCNKSAFSPSVEQTQPATFAFDILAGKNRSLKKPIDLAKAAILYPPNGLHTLLTGPTGVGKTLFAESMHRFAVETGRLDPNAPYVAFNCADYSNNPQLLLAQLFGVEKGAFTGADRDRSGLVEKADGGVLFLDEVHRLPPEGQEMLFQLLDRGMFRRLGESDTHHTAKIRLIGATTENVHSSLLLTFVRRIPMHIPIPSLAERTLEERLLLIQYLLSEESARVQRPFWVAPEVVKALLLFDCPANVGQLKSEIQLLSARSFLSQMQNSDDSLNITFEHVSDHVRAGILRISDRRQELEDLLQRMSKGLMVNGDQAVDATQGLQDDESVYVILEQKAHELRRRGLNEEEINNELSVDINIYFRKFLKRVSREFESRRQDIVRLVGETLLEVVECMFDLASNLLERMFDSQTVFGSALHMRAAVDRIQSGYSIQNPGLVNIRLQAPDEYRTAQQMADYFTERTGIVLPENEIGFLTTILTSTLALNARSRVGILVVAHGESTASSMLAAVHHLLGTSHGAAIDMPMQMGREKVLELAVEEVKRMNEGQGILLLVDMGSLVTLGEELQEHTGIPVKTLVNVSTLAVLEAVRKAALSYASFESVYAGVKQIGSDWDRSYERKPAATYGVLPVVCVTGQGSAMQLKAILEERLVVPEEYDLQIVPVAIRSFDESPDRLQKLLHNRKPLAIVGTLNPNLPDVPFISAQDLLVGNGLQRISHLIGATLAPNTLQAQEGAGSSIWASLMDTFRQTVKRLNPYHVVPLILKALSGVEERLDRTFDLDIRIGMTMHLVMALEKRMSVGTWPTETRAEKISEQLTTSREWLAGQQALQEWFGQVGDALGVVIPPSEIQHLLRLLLQEPPNVHA